MPIDLDFCHRALDLNTKIREKIKEELKQITKLDNPNSNDQFKRFLNEYGYFPDDLTAGTLGGLIDSVEDERVKRALKLKRIYSKRATTKFKKFIAMAGEDSRVRGMFTFLGASRTGRFASRGVNLQNLKSPPFGEIMDDVVGLVRGGYLEAIEALFGDPMGFLSGCVRASIAAPSRPEVDNI